MTGSPKKTAAKRSLYAAAAGVSALYSVNRSPPRSWTKKASSRETGLGSSNPGSWRISSSSQSISPNWRRTSALSRAARYALSKARRRRAERPLRNVYWSGVRNRGRSTLHSGRSPKKSPRRRSWSSS